ncbi:prion-inhibition and propagation-domain-containing protein [Fusarium acuminatum]|uniref:Prion-inhibition and propagation-domain-containing protein n=1 Tax=Fusarium acuminatum TaxID=5515 RepID=A0ABZ2WWR0_9HYPO
MDIAGLAIGIVSLYTACRDCYNFFTTVNSAQTESSAHLRELEIQQSILKAWGFHWEIQNEDDSNLGYSDHTRRKRSKLHAYLMSNRFKAEGVFKTLSALADTLSNQEKLIKRYGIQLQPTKAIQDGTQSNHNFQLVIPDAKIEDVEPVLREVRNRLSVLNKLKWAFKDRDDFKKLIADLRSHSESLYRLCPENAFESMNIYFTMSLTSIDEIKPEMRYLGKGLALFEEQVVYVEMRDYRGPPLDFTEEQKQRLKHRRKRERFLSSYRKPDMSQVDQYSSSDDDEPIERVRPADPKLRDLIRNFFDTFQGANMMKNVYGLDIVGMIDHTEGDDKGHCSVLYRLPGTIGVQSRERPAENLKLRAPVTLQSLLGTKQKKGIRSMLGARFELARKLVRAVCLLHSSGWLHKNIRAESVMFFPEHVNTLQKDRYEVKIEIDVSKPSLMGYIFSRPDDIIIQTNPPSAPEMERLDIPLKSKGISSGTKTWHSLYGDSDLRRQKRTPRSASIYGRNMLGKVASTEEAKETNISGFTLDYYQHPAKHADPKRLYRHAYDVYSLGILLIEVGLWKNLKDDSDSDSASDSDTDSGYNKDIYHDEEDHYERRRKICRKYMDRLRWECGDTYADVVLSCLMIDSSDDEVAKASERELCGRIVADLENCQA